MAHPLIRRGNPSHASLAKELRTPRSHTGRSRPSNVLAKENNMKVRGSPRRERGKPYDGSVTETPSPWVLTSSTFTGSCLTEAEPPRLSPEAELARDRVWNKEVQANPSLFDGPVVACAGLKWDGPHSLALSWARVSYRHYALRRVPGNTLWLPSLFVNVVQPTDGECVMVARMSSSTDAPDGGSCRAVPLSHPRTTNRSRRRTCGETPRVSWLRTGLDLAARGLRCGPPPAASTEASAWPFSPASAGGGRCMNASRPRRPPSRPRDATQSWVSKCQLAPWKDCPSKACCGSRFRVQALSLARG